MKIACYYQPLYGPREKEDRELIDLWIDSWQRHGWETQVLGLDAAQLHPDYNLIASAARQHPTVNGREYEVSCFVRHCAFEISNADLYSDYDMMNYGWTINPEHLKSNIHSFMKGNPALYRATPAGFRWLMANLVTWACPEIVKGQPHISDQTVFTQLPMPSSDECADYPRDSWQTATLVHYGNENIGGDNKARKIMGFRNPLLSK